MHCNKVPPIAFFEVGLAFLSSSESDLPISILGLDLLHGLAYSVTRLDFLGSSESDLPSPFLDPLFVNNIFYHS